jgi:hypothetical protein
MGSKPGQPQSFGVRLAVDQQQVWLDVAFAIAAPFAAQLMIAASQRQRLIVCRHSQNRTTSRIVLPALLAIYALVGIITSCKIS